MRFYVDYENVGTAGLTGIEKLSENDILRIYYSNDPSVNMGTVENIVHSKAKIQFLKMSDKIKAMNQKNALDIIILTDISRQSYQISDEIFSVISCDSGYDSVLSEFSDGANSYIRRVSIDDFFKNAPNNSKSKNKNKKSALSAEMIESINNLFENQLSKYENDRETIISIVTESKTRCDINNSINKKLGSAKAGTIMKNIKPFIKNLPGQ